MRLISSVREDRSASDNGATLAINPLYSGLRNIGTVRTVIRLLSPVDRGARNGLDCVHRCEKSTFPASGISATRIFPFSESVMNRVLRLGPP